MELKIIRCPVHGAIPQNPCYEYEYEFEQATEQSSGGKDKKSIRTATIRYVICKSCGCGYYDPMSSIEDVGFTDIRCNSLTLKPGVTYENEVLSIKRPKRSVVCPIHRVESEDKTGTFQIKASNLMAHYHYCNYCNKGYSDQLTFKYFGSRIADGVLPIEYSNTHLWKYDSQDIGKYSLLKPQTDIIQTAGTGPDEDSSNTVSQTVTANSETNGEDSRLKNTASSLPTGKLQGKNPKKVRHRAVLECPIHKKREKIQEGTITIGRSNINVEYIYCENCQKGYSDQIFFKHFGSKQLDNGVMVSYTESVPFSGGYRIINSGTGLNPNKNVEQQSTAEKIPKETVSDPHWLNGKTEDTKNVKKPELTSEGKTMNAYSGNASPGTAVPEQDEKQATKESSYAEQSVPFSSPVNAETERETEQIPDEGRLSLYQEEEKVKEDVYNTLLGMRKDAVEQTNWSKKQVNDGNFEEADSFVVYQQLQMAKDKKDIAESLVKSLYEKPYFAHLRLREIDDHSDETSDYLLSDNPDLDTIILTKDGGVLIPFKQDEERPMYSAVFHAYQIQTDETIPVNQYSYQLAKITDVEIRRRELLSVRSVYPIEKEEDNGVRANTDELLAQRLQENRNDSYFRNIISSIQAQQFDIIRMNVQTSFVVQGVPGSGKTQCIIHRLFFLRDTLKRDWNSVLFITPTQLFSKYTMPLMSRFHLTDIKKITLAGLYYNLLDEYDERFRFRQYKIEFTEEYLPDGYLREIYAAEWMEQVNQAIKEAIHSYFEAAYQLLDIREWEGRPETAKEANELVRLLNEAAKEFDQIEQELKANEVLTKLRDHSLELEKEVARIEKQIAEREQENTLIQKTIDESNALDEEIKGNRTEQEKWQKEIQEKKWAACERIQEAEKIILRSSGGKTSIQAWIQLQAAMNEYIAYDDPHCFIGRETARYKNMLEEEEQAIKEKQNLLSNGVSYSTWKRRTEEKLLQSQRKIRELNDELLAKQIELEDCRTQLDEQGIHLDQNKQKRARIERTRYFLGRLESAIFETEIWNTLMPLKEKYGIQTLQIEDMEGGKHKETKILYKSDLLFYLRLYRMLHPEFVTHPYRIICVDEGQDLHAADYAMLKELYPNASWNIFGDVQQTLHEGCGVCDWKHDTGIENVYQLNTNYRNNAAIVDFCNRHFGSTMNMFGKIKPEEKPVVVENERALGKVLSPKCALIVKDQSAFSHFCHFAELNPLDFNFYDSHTDSTNDEKPSCFTIYAAKGLEFSEAAVYSYRMTRNQKLVACTRGMNKVYYLDDN